MSWQLLIIISVAALAASTLLQRHLLKDIKHNPLTFTIFFMGCGAVLIFLFAFVRGFDTHYSSLPIQNLILMAGLVTLGNAMMFKSLSKIEASHFALLFTTRTIWSVVIALIFLDERMSVIQIIGSILIVLAAAIATSEGGRYKLDAGHIFALVAAAALGSSFTNSAFILKNGFDVPSYLVLTFGIPAIAIALLYPKAASELPTIVKKGGVLFKSLIVSVLYVTASLTAFLAFQRGSNAAILASIQQTQTIVVVLGGIVLLRELKRVPQKLTATALSFIGLLMVVVK